jgi:IS1 family transposase
MVKRGHGEGTIYWHEGRQRWAVLVAGGYDERGKRVRKYAYGRTKTEARNKLRELLREAEDGIVVTNERCTVGDAVRDWLDHGLGTAGESTRTTNRHLAEGHIIPFLGARRLRDLTVPDVDTWLAGRAKVVSTSTLRKIHSALNRSIKRAMAQDKVKRNVAELATLPRGREGRQSKSLTLGQASAILDAVERSKMQAYVVVSLLTGARTEELRALLWTDVDLVGRLDADPPVPPTMAVWRSVRATGDTKTRLSRRTLALPARCVDVLTGHRESQDRMRVAAGPKWIEMGLVSPRASAPRSMPPTYAATSVPASVGRPALTLMPGLRGSCGTRSCRFCRIAASPLRRSPAWSDTRALWSLNSSTGSSSARSSSPVPPSWISSSRLLAGNWAGRGPITARSPAPQVRNRALTSADCGGRYWD